MYEIRSFHGREAIDLGDEPAPGQFFLDIIGADLEIMGQVNTRLLVEDCRLPSPTQSTGDNSRAVIWNLLSLGVDTVDDRVVRGPALGAPSLMVRVNRVLAIAGPVCGVGFGDKRPSLCLMFGPLCISKPIAGVNLLIVISSANRTGLHLEHGP
jgi:hypothetical protein